MDAIVTRIFVESGGRVGDERYHDEIGISFAHRRWCALHDFVDLQIDCPADSSSSSSSWRLTGLVLLGFVWVDRRLRCSLCPGFFRRLSGRVGNYHSYHTCDNLHKSVERVWLTDNPIRCPRSRWEKSRKKIEPVVIQLDTFYLSLIQCILYDSNNYAQI